MAAIERTGDVLLFDMDGTLIDSLVSVERAWRRFADRHGIDPEPILAVAHGRTTVAVVAQFAPAGFDPIAEAARIEAEEIDATEGITEVPGAGALLSSLDPSRWAVVTSATRELTVRRFAITGLPLPKVLVAADDVTESKPHPQGYLMAAEALGSTASAAVAFEDADAGLRAARASGAATIVVGGHSGEAAAGLPRAADLRQVRVAAAGTSLTVRIATDPR